MYAVSVRSLDKLFKPQSGRDRPAGASTGALEAVEVSREICRVRRTRLGQASPWRLDDALGCSFVDDPWTT